MNNQTVIWMVGIECKAEDESKFNAWYDEVHVPMLLQGGFVQHASRFRLADKSYHVGAVTQKCPTYLTIYEFVTQEKFDAWMTSPARVEAGADKVQTWGDQGYEVQWASLYNNMTSWMG